MKIEYEATFVKVDKDEIRERLTSVGAKLIKLEFLQKRITLNLPSGHELKDGWLRVRDEGDKITLSLKVVDGELGFEWSNAKFCAVGTLYAEKYGITEDKINNQIPKIVFKMENPF